MNEWVASCTWLHGSQKTLQCYKQLRWAVVLPCAVVVNCDASHLCVFFCVFCNVCIVSLQVNTVANGIRVLRIVLVSHIWVYRLRAVQNLLISIQHFVENTLWRTISTQYCISDTILEELPSVQQTVLHIARTKPWMKLIVVKKILTEKHNKF